MKKNIKKKMSIEDLSLSMNKGFRRVESLIEKKIDGLAISTTKGFESVDKRFNEVDKRFNEVEENIKGVKNQVVGVNNRLDDMSLNRVKYEDHNKLKTRVDFIEKNLK
jgi:predicted membrane GTPase involved in stress response